MEKYLFYFDQRRDRTEHAVEETKYKRVNLALLITLNRTEAKKYTPTVPH